MDLSPVYQQVIREATDALRGDFPDYAVFTTHTLVTHFSHPAVSAISAPRILQEDFDPFPQVPFTLSDKPEKVTPHR